MGQDGWSFSVLYMQARRTADAGSFEAAAGVSVFRTIWGLSSLQNGPKGL